MDTNRNGRAKIANDTLDILKKGYYTAPSGEVVSIEKEIEYCYKNTVFYHEDEKLDILLPEHPIKTFIEVEESTTLISNQKAITQFPQLKTLCLNFASAKNPGGGFLGGSQAQEESLARSSGLYGSIAPVTEYYEQNRALGNSLYRHHMIYSPAVPVFRNDNGQLLDQPYTVSMITAPAVNAGAIKKNSPHLIDQLEPVMLDRIERLLDIAYLNGYQHLILGAWGCGVFKNDPNEIAKYFHHHLIQGDYKAVFERITFGILDNTKQQHILNAFQHYFG